MNTDHTAPSPTPPSGRPAPPPGAMPTALPWGKRPEPDRTEAPGAHAEEDCAADDEHRIPDVAVRRRQPLSVREMLPLVLLAGLVVAALWISLSQRLASFAKADASENRPVQDRPAAAGAEPRRLDLSRGTPAGAPPAASAPVDPDSPPRHRVPALIPTEEEMPEPIGVRRSPSPGPANAGAKTAPPEDAPVMLVSTKPVQSAATGAAPRAVDAQPGHRQADPGAEPADPMLDTERNLRDYQRRLQDLLDQLSRASALAQLPDTGSAMAGAGNPGAGAPISPLLSPPAAGPSSLAQRSGGQLLGGQLPRSSTPKATATVLGSRSLTLPKGSAFTCALKSRIVTASAGLVGCIVQRHVYGDDGRVLLIERGSHLDGEYRIAAVRPGFVRIPVLWTRVRTPLGVTVDLDSPATGQLGESGIDGHVDQRWSERIGAAMLLSLIDDSVQLIASKQTEQNHSGTVVLSSTSSSTANLAEKVLDSTINIPPLLYRNQGGIVGIYVARDLDFSSVYELTPSTP